MLILYLGNLLPYQVLASKNLGLNGLLGCLNIGLYQSWRWNWHLPGVTTSAMLIN
jgi:hypothetical protein